MQSDVQAALASKLMEDSTLVAWLAKGTASIYAEGDTTPTTPVPFIVMEYAGSRPLSNTHQAIRDTWIIRAYNKGRGYLEIERMLGRIFRLLNNSTIILPSNSEVYALQQGVRFAGMTKRNYNDVYKAEFEGAIFDVYLFDRQSGV